MSIFPNAPTGARINETLGAASPMLLAMGQNMQMAPHQRNPQAVQQGLAMMMQQAEQKRKRAAYDAMLRGNGGQPMGGGAAGVDGGTPGFNPGASGQPQGAGLSGAMIPPEFLPVLSAMDPEQGMGLLAQILAQQGRPQDPMAGVREVNGRLVRVGPGGVEEIYAAPQEPGEQWVDMTPEEIAQRGLGPGIYQRSATTNQVRAAGTSGTTVNNNNVNTGDQGQKIGTIPPGFTAVQDQSNPSGFRMEPIPGGPVDAERQAQAQADSVRRATIEAAGGTVIQDIGRALEMVGGNQMFTAGPGATLGRRMPGSPAAVLQQMVDSVKSNVGVDQLQQMRDASPTGGALGNVTERQLEGLQSLLGSLDITQPQQVLEDNLKRVSNLYMDRVHGTPDQILAQVREGRLTMEQAAPLMERFPLSFDERGRTVPPGQQQTQQPQQQPPQQQPAPPGFRPEEWGVLTPEERQEYIGGEGAVNPSPAAQGGETLPSRVNAVVELAQSGNQPVTPITLARAFTGANETRDAQVIGSFIRKFGGAQIDPRQTAWCAAFVNGVLGATGNEGTGRLNARSFLQWGEAVETPTDGDVVVLWRESPDSWKGHVGFFAGRTTRDGREYVRVVGGNQNDSVSEKLYPADRVLGYRRPEQSV